MMPDNPWPVETIPTGYKVYQKVRQKASKPFASPASRKEPQGASAVTRVNRSHDAENRPVIASEAKHSRFQAASTTPDGFASRETTGVWSCAS